MTLGGRDTSGLSFGKTYSTPHVQSLWPRTLEPICVPDMAARAHPSDGAAERRRLWVALGGGYLYLYESQHEIITIWRDHQSCSAGLACACVPVQHRYCLIEGTSIISYYQVVLR